MIEFLLTNWWAVLFAVVGIGMLIVAEWVKNK